jgi:HD superfamily phosphohydrolase
MGQKLFRDPVYDYISIDTNKYPWLLELINCPEVQRLRFISQLGLSHVAYPGATHSRFSHALGVFHLMQQCLTYLKTDHNNHFDPGDEDALLAASLLHDIGHGPFSHVTEGFFGDHEDRGLGIIQSENSGVNKVLANVNKDLPLKVAALIAKRPPQKAVPAKLWQQSLISSQLDVDRMDYLRRDSLFSGAEYGKFDWYRIIHTIQLEEEPNSKDIWVVWPDKSKYAIEEYIFSRFYMYQSVYYHHTSRGFEGLLKKILECARDTAKKNGKFAETLLPQMRVIMNEKTPLEDFYRLTDYVVLSQIAIWQDSKYPVISDLSSRLLKRNGLGWKEQTQLKMTKEAADKIVSACEYLGKNGLDYKYYFFDDETPAALYRPYNIFGIEELSPVTSIILYDSSRREGFREISGVKGLKRVKAIVEDAELMATVRYYFPREHEKKIAEILEGKG